MMVIIDVDNNVESINVDVDDISKCLIHSTLKYCNIPKTAEIDKL
jgi:hypothetical protein